MNTLIVPLKVGVALRDDDLLCLPPGEGTPPNQLPLESIPHLLNEVLIVENTVPARLPLLEAEEERYISIGGDPLGQNESGNLVEGDRTTIQGFVKIPRIHIPRSSNLVYHPFLINFL